MEPLFHNISGGTILIVEDEVDLALLLKTYFLRKASTVHISHTLHDALSGLGQVAPDVVILSNRYHSDLNRTVEQILHAVSTVKLITCGKTVAYCH